MQFDVNIRLYEYWHEQVKIRKKRWNNKEITKFYYLERLFLKRNVRNCPYLFWSFESQALVARTYHPPFSNFLFTNLFSIKFLYFFIISSLLPFAFYDEWWNINLFNYHKIILIHINCTFLTKEKQIIDYHSWKTNMEYKD
jgi:hypothetical protein